MEVELGQYLGLRQEVEDEEKKFQALKQEKYNERLKREKNIAKGAKQKALRAKKYHEAHFTLCSSKSHVLNANAEHTYKHTKLLINDLFKL